ncbi:MAG: hypothetical protein J6E43_08670 [Prevotella sp.]|nr:hypothetical protein [Prevotella sp.]
MKTISRYIMTLALLITAATGAWADAAYYVVGNFTNWSTNDAYKMTLNTECTSTTEYMLTLNLPADAQFKVVKDDGQGQTWYPDGMGNAYGENGELSGAGKYTVYFRPNVDGNPDWFYSVMYVAAATPGTVVVNEAKTEASFEMPTYDVNVNYELVRDMSVQMTATMGDGTDGERYRVKKNEQNPGKYEPAEMDMMQVLTLVKVHDAIENYDLTLNQDYFCRIYKLNEQTQQPDGDGVELADFDFAPGLYALKAFATDGSNYDGETALSNTFVLFEGYEVVIPAGEYVTYYKDEAVRLDEKDMNDIELCTITAVEDGKAVLSDNFDAMTANTPFLLKNTTTEEKTILLIPCNEPNLAVTVAKEFIGTLTEKTFNDQEMGAGDFYVCNGKEFIKVRGAGTLAANKAYLKVTGNAPASIPFRRSIDGGEGTTGVDLIDNGKLIIDNDGWYDLNGRRLQGKPSQKGVYIKNGKKIVIK